MVPPSPRIPATWRGVSGLGACSPRRPAQPSVIPRTSCPSALARRTTARIAALSPGASPPPVSTPMRKARCAFSTSEAPMLAPFVDPFLRERFPTRGYLHRDPSAMLATVFDDLPPFAVGVHRAGVPPHQRDAVRR